MQSQPSSDKHAKARLVADIAAAESLARSGRSAEAEEKLGQIAGDPYQALLGPRTALGLPRKLHSAWIRWAKITGDRVRLAGLRVMAVPPDEVTGDLFRPGPELRAALVSAASWPLPRYIHQVWIGGHPPVACAAWADYAARHGWSYRLWDEDALDGLGVTADPLWQAMLEAGDLPGAVDVARYHVLIREGGIYLDCDWYPARPDLPPQAVLPLHGLVAIAESSARLVAGDSLLLSNALIMAPPEHPALIHLVAALPALASRLPDAPAWWVTGPIAFTLAARQGPVTVLNAGVVAGSLPRGAAHAEARALAARTEAANEAGFLIAWKGW